MKAMLLISQDATLKREEHYCYIFALIILIYARHARYSAALLSRRKASPNYEAGAGLIRIRITSHRLILAIVAPPIFQSTVLEAILFLIFYAIILFYVYAPQRHLCCKAFINWFHRHLHFTPTAQYICLRLLFTLY